MDERPLWTRESVALIHMGFERDREKIDPVRRLRHGYVLLTIFR